MPRPCRAGAGRVVPLSALLASSQGAAGIAQRHCRALEMQATPAGRQRRQCQGTPRLGSTGVLAGSGPHLNSSLTIGSFIEPPRRAYGWRMTAAAPPVRWGAVKARPSSCAVGVWMSSRCCGRGLVMAAPGAAAAGTCQLKGDGAAGGEGVPGHAAGSGWQRTRSIASAASRSPIEEAGSVRAAHAPQRGSSSPLLARSQLLKMFEAQDAFVAAQQSRAEQAQWRQGGAAC